MKYDHVIRCFSHVTIMMLFSTACQQKLPSEYLTQKVYTVAYRYNLYSLIHKHEPIH